MFIRNDSRRSMISLCCSPSVLARWRPASSGQAMRHVCDLFVQYVCTYCRPALTISPSHHLTIDCSGVQTIKQRVCACVYVFKCVFRRVTGCFILCIPFSRPLDETISYISLKLHGRDISKKRAYHVPWCSVHKFDIAVAYVIVVQLITSSYKTVLLTMIDTSDD